MDLKKAYDSDIDSDSVGGAAGVRGGGGSLHQAIQSQSESCVRGLVKVFSGEDWPSPGLGLVTNPVCGIHGQDIYMVW